MNNKAYETFVASSASPKYDRKLAVIGLMGEVGELADVIKKETIYEDMSKFEEKYGMSVRDKIIDEVGDCMYQLTLVLVKYGTSLDEIMEKNYDKLMKRHGGQGVAKDGGKR